VGGNGLEIVIAGLREDDEHPLIPRLHGSYDGCKAPGWMFNLGCQTPMDISHAGLDVLGQVDVDENVECQALAGLPQQRDIELSHDRGSGAFAAEEVFGGDLIGLSCELV
jgi:hypothetical protein